MGKAYIATSKALFGWLNEQSAYLVCLSRAYKPTKKYVKNCNKKS